MQKIQCKALHATQQVTAHADDKHMKLMAKSHFLASQSSQRELSSGNARSMMDCTCSDGQRGKDARPAALHNCKCIHKTDINEGLRESPVS